jgi:hypothetical protein
MSVQLRYDQACSVIGCLKPARELGGLCTPHWCAALPSTRADLKWEASWEDPAWDVVRAAEAMLGE